ncbi:MAG: C13 family peptidase, partial [Pseudomonadota bacterium]
TSLRQSLKHVGEMMNVDEDVVVLYVTSHGSEKHELAVDFRPLRFTAIDPLHLKKALDESGIRWKVIVISACYSGGFIDALKDERTLIITAASADRTSFGCGNASDATYLSKALFGEALTKTHSFESAFDEARTLIERWEREQGHIPSQPQIHVGAQIKGKLAEIERRLAGINAAVR